VIPVTTAVCVVPDFDTFRPGLHSKRGLYFRIAIANFAPELNKQKYDQVDS